VGRGLNGRLDPIGRWPVDHVGAGWVSRRGCGDLGDEAAGEVAGEADRPFALASVTKVLTAMAGLVAVEEEVVDLDEAAGPDGSTVRHLLAHASGLGPDHGPPLAAPGTRRIYSNAGYEVLADLVEERSGMPFATYLHDALCVPLGLTATALEGSAAHGATSTVTDLLAVCAELLAPSRVLAPETVDLATSVAWPELAGVLPGYGAQDPNPWGLGPEVRGTKAPHWTPDDADPATFGHFGQAGTMLWCDPVAGIGCVALADREFGPWAVEAWPELGASVLAGSTVN
jgi:CubicO group peptidase (beta-lactamase class C family)